MNSAIAALLVLLLSAATGGRLIREGYATTYSYHDKAAPELVFIPTMYRGISLSDTRDPIAMREWSAQFSRPPKPYFIRVFPDHITALNPQTHETSTIALRDVVEIVWQK